MSWPFKGTKMFSNFFTTDINVNGETHTFQLTKALRNRDNNVAERLRSATTAHDAKRIDDTEQIQHGKLKK